MITQDSANITKREYPRQDNVITSLIKCRKSTKGVLLKIHCLWRALIEQKSLHVRRCTLSPPALKAAGVNLDELTLSTTSLYETRKVVREKIADSVKNKFLLDTPLIAHFDGKLLPNNDGMNYDRLPIVVSGIGVEKLLAIPKLSTGTGLQMGKTIVEVLQDWNGVPEWLAGLCFDTTSSNTGVHTGAISVIQKAFEKRLLFLACRHHILEIVAAAVFDLFFTSSGPQIAIFCRFKQQWPFIDQTLYASLDKQTTGCILTSDKRLRRTCGKIGHRL